MSGAPYPINPQAPKEEDFFTNSSNYFVFGNPRPEQGPVGPSDAVPNDPFAPFNVINKATAKSDWFQSNYERQSGGSTWHWLGTSLRLLPHDFQLASTYRPSIGGLTAYDWPFTYNDIEPWYGRRARSRRVGADTGGDYLGITRSSELPDAGNPAELSGSTIRRRAQRPDVPTIPGEAELSDDGVADATGAQLPHRAMAGARSARARRLHSDLSDSGEVRRHAARGHGAADRQRAVQELLGRVSGARGHHHPALPITGIQ
jgi:choline dehydrogenase-like flavoprotein